MSVEYVWAGAGTDTSVWVRGRVTGSSTRLLVSGSSDLSGPVFYGPVVATAQGIASIEATDLDPDTRYWYALEDDGVVDTAFSGTFRTHPVLGSAASFTVGAAGDAGLAGTSPGAEHITNSVSNNPVFDTMRARALAEEWVQFLHLGDLHYRDIATNSHTAYRNAYRDTLTFNNTLGANARQGQFFRSASMAYVWDDHDFGPNNSDRTHVGRQAASEVYREIVPHYPLPAQGLSATNAPIFQSWQIGRVLFIGADTRWARDPNNAFGSTTKTMLGSEQKRWMERLLRNTSAEALVWALPSMWLSDQGEVRNAGIARSGADYSTDSYWLFRHEREELVELFGDTGWLKKMVCLQADKHALSMSSGPGNPWGGFPLWMFASLDSGFSTHPEGQYDLGQSTGRQRYGTVRVVDSGHTIALHGTGYVMDQVWRSHTAYAHVEPHVVQVNYMAGETFDPFDPTDDDQQLVNDFTASRTDGGDFQHEQTTGPVSTEEPPHGVGRYSGSDTFNVPSDQDLPDQAGWAVHQGTVDAARFPAIGFNLTNPRMEELRDQIGRIDSGDQINVTDPPAWLPPEAIGLIAEGYSERINTHEWEIEYNASPAETAQVGQVAPDLVLNPNHNFEVHAQGWEPVGGIFQRGQIPVHRGLWALGLLPNGSTEIVRARTRLADSPRVYAGVEYTFSVWVYSAQGYTVDMSVQWFDDAGGSLGFPIVGSPVNVPAEVWTQVTAGAVAPEGAHRMRWNINQRGTPTTSDILVLDEAIMSDGSAPGVNGPNRVDTDGSVLAAPVGEDDTDLLVATTQTPFGGARWINSSGPTVTHEQEFPFDLRVGGEVVRATGCEGALWDVFRTARPTGSWGTSDQGTGWVDTTVADTTVGTSVSALYGFVQLNGSTSSLRVQEFPEDVVDCEVLWTIRASQTSSGAAQLPSLILRRSGVNDFYRCRVHLNTNGTVSLSVTRGVTQIGGTVALPHLRYTPSTALSERIFVRTRLVGNRVMARAWKVALPSGSGASLNLGFLEPAHWQIDRTIIDNPIPVGRVGFSASTFAGYSGSNPSMRFQMLEMVTPQRMTVERSINTVTKSHEVGSVVSLDQPAIIGL